MNRQRNTLDRPTDETRRSPNKMAPMAMGALAMMVLLAAYGLAVYGLAVPALAQNEDGAITTLTLTSDTPGEIEISWEAPEPAPSDYRIRWTPDGEAYPSYKDDNQADRGNEYPGGDETSLTLTGLPHGTQYKVQARARYSGGTPPSRSLARSHRDRGQPRARAYGGTGTYCRTNPGAYAGTGPRRNDHRAVPSQQRRGRTHGELGPSCT